MKSSTARLRAALHRWHWLFLLLLFYCIIILWLKFTSYTFYYAENCAYNRAHAHAQSIMARRMKTRHYTIQFNKKNISFIFPPSQITPTRIFTSSPNRIYSVPYSVHNNYVICHAFRKIPSDVSMATEDMHCDDKPIRRHIFPSVTIRPFSAHAIININDKLKIAKLRSTTYSNSNNVSIRPVRFHLDLFYFH